MGMEKYKLIDRETQKGVNEILYEIYGISRGGILFERDIENPDRILRHIYHGVKAQDSLNDYGDTFFKKREDGCTFFAAYEDYPDYEYSPIEKDLTEAEKIQCLKEYVYLKAPHIGRRTSVGWVSEGEIKQLENPNWCYNHIQLDDKKDYTIIKRRDTVKLFKGNVGREFFDTQDDLVVVSFKLQEELFLKALKLANLRLQISDGMYRYIPPRRLTEYVSLEEELRNALRK